MNKKLTAVLVSLMLLLSMVVSTGAYAAEAGSAEEAASGISSVQEVAAGSEAGDGSIQQALSEESTSIQQGAPQEGASSDISSQEAASSGVSSQEAASSGVSGQEAASEDTSSIASEGAAQAAVIFSADAVSVYPEQKDFDLASLVSAQDEKGQPLPVSVSEEAAGAFTREVPGTYPVIYTAVHEILGPVSHTVMVTVQEAFAYAPQPARPAEVFQAVDQYLLDNAAYPLPLWKEAIPASWVPKGFILVEKTDEISGAVYWTLEEGYGRQARSVFVNVTVNSVAELKDLAERATDNTIYTLSPSYVEDFKVAGASSITLNNGVDIVINGDGQTLATSVAGAKHFNVTNNAAAGSVTLQNMTLSGGLGQGGVVLNKGVYNVSDVNFSNFTIQALTITAGEATLSNTNFTDFTGTGGKAINIGAATVSIKDSAFKNLAAVAINNAGTTVLTVDNTTFEDIKSVGITGGKDVTVTNSLFNRVQRAGDHGSAIRMGTNLTVKNSSFINSGGGESKSGYIHGAIVGFQTGHTLLVEGSYFEGNNSNKYGGAIGLYQYGGTATIRNSYFKGNSVNQPADPNSADGGAVGIFNNGQTATLTIEGSVFEGNTAGDNGGAIFMETNVKDPAGLVKGIFTNNTFINNAAANISGNPGGGGAFQLSWTSEATFTNNTFVGNTTGASSDGKIKGTAVGVHTYLLWGPATSFYNNLFADNLGKTDSSTSVNLFVNPTANTGNIGYDYKVSRPAELSFKTVFGTTSAPAVGPNGSSIMAGKPGSGYETVLPSVYIAPAIGDTAGLYADGAGQGGTAVDERGYARSTTNPDAGAVEIFWAKFVADGGYWASSTQYTYSSPYLFNTLPGETNPTEVYSVSNSPAATNAPVAAPVRDDGYEFKGWSTVSGDATKIVTSFPADQKNSTYYAIWAPPVTYSVTYEANGGQGTVPSDANQYAPASQVTVLSHGQLSKSGYTFVGWKNDQDGLTYQAGDTFTISQNVILTAQWKQDPIPEVYTVAYEANGGQGTLPSDNGIYVANSQVTVLAPGQLSKIGYTFAGWKNSQDGRTYQAGDRFIITGNVLLTAQWLQNPTPITYKVTYNANGGQGAVPSDNKAYPSGSQVTVLAPDQLSKSGYTFIGWKNEVDGTIYQAGKTFIITRDVTLTAQWSPVPPASSSTPPASSSTPPASSNTPPASSSTPPASSSTPPASSSKPTSSSSSASSTSSSSSTSSVPTSSSRTTSSRGTTPSSSASVPGPITPASIMPSADQQREEVRDQLIDAGVPSVQLGNSQIPLFGGGQGFVWSLVSLLLMVASILTSAIVAVRMLLKNKEEQDNRRKLLKILSIALGVIAVICFFVIYNLSGVMVLVDVKTILFLLIFLVELGVLYMGRSKEHKANSRVG